MLSTLLKNYCCVVQRAAKLRTFHSLPNISAIIRTFYFRTLLLLLSLWHCPVYIGLHKIQNPYQHKLKGFC